MTSPGFRPALSLFLWMVVASCAFADAWKAEVWRSADRLFHSDPRWLGGDAAFSVPLGGDRILWLFGDSFIGDGRVGRQDSAFIRNSIAVQRGRDLSIARMDFYWRDTEAGPTSYFPSSAGAWLWPLHGVQRRGVLTLFFMRVEPSSEGLGFKVIGSAAMRCENPGEPPDRWRLRALALPKLPFEAPGLLGVAVLSQHDDVLAYCVADREDHPAYLARWKAADFDRGDLSAPEWWDGARYVPSGALANLPAEVIPLAASEFSVHRLLDGRYIQVQTAGFGATNVETRFALRPEGPWSAPEVLFRPRESGWRDTMVYAGKAHPAIEGAPIVVTYATNHFDPRKLLSSKRLYFPRVMRVSPKP